MGGRRKMLLLAGLLLLLAMLSGPTTAECPNGCSGNGVCMRKDMCDCHKNYQGNDCLDRTCQFGYAHVDTPKGDIDMDQDRKTPNWILTDSQQAPAGTYEYFSPDAATSEAHFYMECSNKGLCDRALGTCTCFDGFEGVACQRAACPNKCSGHGTCESLRELGLKTPGTLFGIPDDPNQITYDLWDSRVTYGCRCDPWYHGADCSLRSCKVGVDPMFLSVGSATTEVFALHVWLDGTTYPTTDSNGNVDWPANAGDYVRLRLFDYHGESYVTDAIPIITDVDFDAANDPTSLELAEQNAAAVTSAILKIPNLTFSTVLCEPTNANVGDYLFGYKSTRPLATHGLSVVCRFTSNPGRLRAPEIAAVTFHGVVDPAKKNAVVYTMQRGADDEWFTEDSGVVITAVPAGGATLTVTNTNPAQSDSADTLFKVGSHVLLGTLSGSTITLVFPVAHSLGTINHRFNAQKDDSGVSRLTVSAVIAVKTSPAVGDTTILMNGAATGLAVGNLVFFENQFYTLKAVAVTVDTTITLDRPFGGNSLNGGANTIKKLYLITPPDKSYQYNYLRPFKTTETHQLLSLNIGSSTMRSWFHGRSAPRGHLYDHFVRQLSTSELHAASSAFNRARGNFTGLDVDRFQKVLSEICIGVPEYLAPRLFREWNVSGTGEISHSEFVGGVAIAVKGLHDDHLEMVFRMLSANGDGSNVSRSDVSRFLKCFDRVSNCAASRVNVVARSWGDEFLCTLSRVSPTGTFTIETLRAAAVSCRAHNVHLLTQWIAEVGARLLQVHPLTRPLITAPCDFNRVHIVDSRDSIPSTKREAFRCELRSVLFIISTGSPGLTFSFIVQRFREVLDDDCLIDALIAKWSNASPSERAQRMMASVTNDTRELLKLFVLRFCCIHASNVHQVYRLVFELFDEHNRGQLGVDQLSSILHLTKQLSPMDSERDANIIIKRRGKSQSSSPSPPTSPSGSVTVVKRPQVLTFEQFIEVAQELPGYSFAEVETLFLLFHLKQHPYSSSPNIHDDHMPLRLLFSSYSSEMPVQSTAFCLLSPEEWQLFVEDIEGCQTDLLANTHAQILYQEATELQSDHVIIRLSLWLLVTYWHRNHFNTQSRLHGYSADEASSIQLCRKSQTALNGFWIRILINLTSHDGFERIAVFQQVIAFEQCTVQSVLEAALFWKDWSISGQQMNSDITSLFHCQVLAAERNDAGEIRALTECNEPIALTQGQLTTPLGTAFSSIFPTRFLGKAVHQGKPSFELRFSVVEIEQQGISTNLDVLEDMGLSLYVLETASSSSSCSTQYAFRYAGVIPRGLRNLGNTCFMNAVLQCLATTPFLQSCIIETNCRHVLLSLSSSFSPRDSGSKSFISVMAEFFTQISSKNLEIPGDDHRIVSPSNLLKTFSSLSPQMFDGSQQDAQEFLAWLLGFLGTNMKRSPDRTQHGDTFILSPRSHVFLTNLSKSKDRGFNIATTTEQKSCIEGSNGRHDRVVATEWWVSHVVSEPSLTNALFSGQFKSVLTCNHCAHLSARFEPFSSLQLPLVEDGINSEPPNDDQLDFVVIIHLAESHRTSIDVRGPIRTVVQVYHHSTVTDLFAQLPAPRSKKNSVQYIVGNVEGCTIQNLLLSDITGDHINDETPASVLPSPTHIFEVFNFTSNGDNSATPTADSTRLIGTLQRLFFVVYEKMESLVAAVTGVQVAQVVYSSPLRLPRNYLISITVKPSRSTGIFNCIPKTPQHSGGCDHIQLEITPTTSNIALKRFELSTANGNYQWRKLSHNVDFPVHGLDLGDLLSPVEGGHDDSEPCTARCFVDGLDPRARRGIEYLQNELRIPLTSASRSCTKYDLYAVVNHCGRGMSSGHYTAHIRRPDEPCWWSADDAVVTPVNEDELSPSATAYLLFYVRQDVASGTTELSDIFPTD
ncbi:unnamed protein product [Phytophthora fragariaefolia]|uniref:Unnamed protein product n=1 Tax=Phytophthora fragariaefolia TaxID=1490495 RepID=A0A9W7CVF9_9STRA|nr:unnamed protein product [Phytophthora fragariaefolia]